MFSVLISSSSDAKPDPPAQVPDDEQLLQIPDHIPEEDTKEKANELTERYLRLVSSLSSSRGDTVQCPEIQPPPPPPTKSA